MGKLNASTVQCLCFVEAGPSARTDYILVEVQKYFDCDHLHQRDDDDENGAGHGGDAQVRATLSIIELDTVVIILPCYNFNSNIIPCFSGNIC